MQHAIDRNRSPRRGGDRQNSPKGSPSQGPSPSPRGNFYVPQSPEPANSPPLASAPEAIRRSRSPIRGTISPTRRSRSRSTDPEEAHRQSSLGPHASPHAQLKRAMSYATYVGGAGEFAECAKCIRDLQAMGSLDPETRKALGDAKKGLVFLAEQFTVGDDPHAGR